MRVIAISVAYLLGILTAAPWRPWWGNVILLVGFAALGVWCCFASFPRCGCERAK